MYQYAEYYHPFTTSPYTAQNIIWYPYSYPNVYHAPYIRDPYINYPLYLVQQQYRPMLRIVEGIWDTHYGTTAGATPNICVPMQLSQSDDGLHIVGTYGKQAPEKIDGEFHGYLVPAGNTAYGEWFTYPKDGVTKWNHGKFKWTFKPDGRSFEGKWGYGDDTPSMPWVGTKR